MIAIVLIGVMVDRQALTVRTLMVAALGVLLIAPVTLAITRRLKVPPYPFLFAEVMASNIGGTATLIGDPPNIMIGSYAHLTFVDFVKHLTVINLIALVVVVVMASGSKDSGKTGTVQKSSIWKPGTTSLPAQAVLLPRFCPPVTLL